MITVATEAPGLHQLARRVPSIASARRLQSSDQTLERRSGSGCSAWPRRRAGAASVVGTGESE
jgi:hypothetical protein